MNKISKEMKMILGGAALCVMGAVALDCGIQVTGVMLVCLGAAAIIMGPLAVSL
jgi:hypothetical protein